MVSLQIGIIRIWEYLCKVRNNQLRQAAKDAELDNSPTAFLCKVLQETPRKHNIKVVRKIDVSML